MGSIGMVGSERAVSVGDEVRRAKHSGVRQHVLHGSDRSVLSGGDVPSPVRDFHSVCGFDIPNDLLHLLSVAGNQASSDRRGLSSLGKSSVLEDDC